jgi:hypothetical protein
MSELVEIIAQSEGETNDIERVLIYNDKVTVTVWDQTKMEYVDRDFDFHWLSTVREVIK